MSVQRRCLEFQTGYSVIAEAHFDLRGAEVGFSKDINEARARGKELKNDPSRWIGNKVGFIMIYDVATCQIIEEVYADGNQTTEA